MPRPRPGAGATRRADAAARQGRTFANRRGDRVASRRARLAPSPPPGRWAAALPQPLCQILERLIRQHETLVADPHLGGAAHARGRGTDSALTPALSKPSPLDDVPARRRASESLAPRTPVTPAAREAQILPIPSARFAKHERPCRPTPYASRGEIKDRCTAAGAPISPALVGITVLPTVSERCIDRRPHSCPRPSARCCQHSR